MKRGTAQCAAGHGWRAKFRGRTQITIAAGELTPVLVGSCNPNRCPECGESWSKFESKKPTSKSAKPC